MQFSSQRWNGAASPALSLSAFGRAFKWAGRAQNIAWALSHNTCLWKWLRVTCGTFLTRLNWREKRADWYFDVLLLFPPVPSSSDSWSCNVSVSQCIKLFGSFLNVNELSNNLCWMFFLAGVGSRQSSLILCLVSLSVWACICACFHISACMSVKYWVGKGWVWIAHLGERKKQQKHGILVLVLNNETH